MHKGISATMDPDLIRDNYTVRQKEEVRQDFSDEELIEMKENLFIASNNQAHREEIISRVREIMEMPIGAEEIKEMFEEISFNNIGNDGLKSLKSEFKRQLKMINQGYEIVTVDVFGFDYQEIGRMAFYNEAGGFVYDRPLTPNEKQTTIHSLHKIDGTHG